MGAVAKSIPFILRERVMDQGALRVVPLLNDPLSLSPRYDPCTTRATSIRLLPYPEPKKGSSFRVHFRGLFRNQYPKQLLRGSRGWLI